MKVCTFTMPIAYVYIKGVIYYNFSMSIWLLNDDTFV